MTWLLYLFVYVGPPQEVETRRGTTAFPSVYECERVATIQESSFILKHQYAAHLCAPAKGSK